jgi:hypothetical protein
MSDAIYQCKCGFKCVESMLSKTEGYCSVCKEGRADMLEKYGKAKWSKRVI